MRVMVLIKASEDTEAGVLPSKQLLTSMGKFNDELATAGVLVAGEGLKPTSKGVRVRFADSERTVVNGPFTGTRDLIAGFWIWQVKSMDEAINWVKRCPSPTGAKGEIEIRPLYEAADFGENFTPELQEQEKRPRMRTRGHTGA